MIEIYKTKHIMAVTPQQFFDKNLKWFALALLFLLAFKSVQSCNRKTQLSMGSKQYIEQIDSLKNLQRESQDSIKKLNFELRLANDRTNSANEKANAVQSAVEKIKSNTTITVKGAEEVKDSIKKRK